MKGKVVANASDSIYYMEEPTNFEFEIKRWSIMWTTAMGVPDSC